VGGISSTAHTQKRFKVKQIDSQFMSPDETHFLPLQSENPEFWGE
jgi:hypothetical protein